MALKPTWNVLRQLGEDAAQDMGTLLTFDEIGIVLEVSWQQARNECNVALGKLVYGLKHHLANDIAIYNGVKPRAKRQEKSK